MLEEVSHTGYEFLIVSTSFKLINEVLDENIKKLPDGVDIGLVIRRLFSKAVW